MNQASGDSRMMAYGVLDNIIKKQEDLQEAFKVLRRTINWDLLDHDDETLLWKLFNHIEKVI